MRFRTVLLGLLALVHPARRMARSPDPGHRPLPGRRRARYRGAHHRADSLRTPGHRRGGGEPGRRLGFRPICQVFVSSFVMVAGQGGPSDARSAIEVARTRPRALAIGFGGTFTGTYFSVVRIMRAAGAELNAVPFRGDPPLFTDLMAGDMPLGVLTLGSAIANADRLPVLMTFTRRREPALPDVPTATELGWLGIEEQFGGLRALAGLLESIGPQLEAECVGAKDALRVAEMLHTAGDAAAFRGGADVMAALTANAEAKRATLAEAAMWTD